MPGSPMGSKVLLSKNCKSTINHSDTEPAGTEIFRPV